MRMHNVFSQIQKSARACVSAVCPGAQDPPSPAGGEGCEFRAGLRNCKPVAVIFAFVVVEATTVLLMFGEHLKSALFLLALLVWWARLRSRVLVFVDDHMTYDGWFGRTTIVYAEITRIVHTGDAGAGWPEDRVHGPSEYKVFLAGREPVWVSFLWFAPAAFRMFNHQVYRCYGEQRRRATQPAKESTAGSRIR